MVAPTRFDPSAVRHRVVDALGTRIHVAEMGEGPLVLFVHGFPESWYSWRYQLPAVAAAGFRAAAIDVRGYGRSAKPGPIEEYRMVRHVADNVGVVRALGAETATVIGHDWGSPIAANTALLRPDVFTAVALLSVPFSPRGALSPRDAFRMMGGDEEFYIEYFQEPGRAEAEIEADLGRWLLGFYHSASGDAEPMLPGNGSMATVAPGGKLSDRFRWPETMPTWLSQDDLDYYRNEFERTGLTGGLNRYRNVQRDWHDLAMLDAKPITQPSLFIGGEKDGPTLWGAGAIARFGDTMPNLTKSVIVPGSGHWVQQEAAEVVNTELCEFLAAVPHRAGF
jgi:pimeloyl-ACP methyl ester carboxylesterase